MAGIRWSDADFRNFALAILSREHRGGSKTENASEEISRKNGLRGVEFHHLVIVELAREGDAVFRRGKLFLEQLHAFDRAKLRILFGDRDEFRERAAQCGFRVRAVGNRSIRRSDSLRASLSDRFKGRTLVGHVALGGSDKVRNQVVATLKLDVNVGPGIADANAQDHQRIEHRDEPNQERSRDCGYSYQRIRNRFAPSSHFLTLMMQEEDENLVNEGHPDGEKRQA